MTRRIFCKVLLVIVAIFGLLALSGVLLAQGRSEEALEHVKEVQERNTNWLMAMDGVEGTAIGYNPNARLSIQVFLERPGVRGIPQELEGIPVHPVITGKIYALADPTARFDRPVPIGVSTGHPNITAGTIGCRVTDGTNVYALSNNHVYADENNAKIDDAVIQPGAFDGGSLPDDFLGTLVDFEPIKFDGPDNTIDAAIALSDTSLLGTATPSDGYGIPSSTTVQASLRLKVQKYGRTTGLTSGKIDAVNATVDVGYDSGVARFVGQIIIRPGGFSAGGDSGSLIVTQSGNNPVGLLFAGSMTVTVANPIQPVLTRFGVTVDDEEPTQNEPPTVSIISPEDGSIFDSGELIAFEGTADDTEDDDLTAALAWTSSIDGLIGTGGSFFATLSDGTHTITAEVTDSGDKTGSDSVTITVGTPTEGTVSVDSINYSTEGGKDGNKHLNITVALVDDLDNPVPGAFVSIYLENTTTGQSWTSADTTGTDGTVTYRLNNAPSGHYETTVIDVVVAELTWDGVTPENGYDKP